MGSKYCYIGFKINLCSIMPDCFLGTALSRFSSTPVSERFIPQTLREENTPMAQLKPFTQTDDRRLATPMAV